MMKHLLNWKIRESARLSQMNRTIFACKEDSQKAKTNPDVPRNLILLGHIRQKTTWFSGINERKP